MGYFKGITSEALLLLAQVQFNDSKMFYDENKEKCKQLATIPMQHLFMDLSQTMAEIDGQILLEPTRCVSRIRRDTRFTKDKRMYRQNIWLTFSRPKSELYPTPCFYFEISINGYEYGCGNWNASPKFAEFYRKEILSNPGEFEKIIKHVEKFGFKPYGELYKKDRPGNIPNDLREYYNRKSLGFTKSFENISALESSDLVAVLKNEFATLSVFYNFLLDILGKMQSAD